MREIIFFSNNINKINEISKIISLKSYKILNLNNFDTIKSPQETGLTFEENAKIKSLFSFNKFNKMSFADDSGICINALNKKPGVNSKNYLEKHKDRNVILNQIISITQKKNDFKAFFQTCISLTINKNKHFFFNGIIKGKISDKIKGSEGFGYDPIFIPDGHDKTFSEMNLDEKNLISHRSIAINKLNKFLIKN